MDDICGAEDLGGAALRCCVRDLDGTQGVFGMAGRLGWLRAAGEEETERLQGETEGMELEAGGVPRRRRGRRGRR